MISDNPGFGRVVGALGLGMIRDKAGHRGGVDEAASPSSEHDFAKLTATVEDGSQIDIDYFVPYLIGAFFRRNGVRDAGVVKGNIDSTAALLNMLGEPANLHGACQIRLEELDAKLLGGDLSSIGVNIGEHDDGTVILQSLGGLKADTACGSGNDRHAVLQGSSGTVIHSSTERLPARIELSDDDRSPLGRKRLQVRLGVLEETKERRGVRRTPHQ